MIYYPAGVSYGAPSFGIIASIYETNINETLEYLSSIPNYIYTLMCIYFLVLISVIYSSKQIYHIEKEEKNIHFNMDNFTFLRINKAN